MQSIFQVKYFHYSHDRHILRLYLFFFLEIYKFLYDTAIEVFKLEMFIPYHHEFIANFMIYLTSFSKKTNTLTNVGIVNLLIMFYLSIIINFYGVLLFCVY